MIRAWLLAAVLLAGCVHERQCDPTHTLYIVSHGWHAGVVVKTEDLRSRLPQLPPSAGRYVEIGWGEERFYQARDTTIGMALRAVLRPNASVLQVVSFSEEPRRYFASSRVTEMRTDAAGYEAAIGVIARTFTRELQPLGRSLYGDGTFYRAEGAFHLFNNCHHWVTAVTDAARCRAIH